jgi:DNA mismatch repair protein MutH
VATPSTRLPAAAEPPATEAELIARALHLAGRSLGELAAAAGCEVPADLRRNKGWVGQFVERLLGATGGGAALPDFPHLGIELKTPPIDQRRYPLESTHICTAPVQAVAALRWQQSWLRQKLARVLWQPVEGERTIPLADRRLATPFLWSPSAEDEAILRQDWDELGDFFVRGEAADLSARFGSALQIRPKAAHSRIVVATIDSEGERALINPRGFYLRPGFTHALLQRQFA